MWEPKHLVGLKPIACGSQTPEGTQVICEAQIHLGVQAVGPVGLLLVSPQMPCGI